MQQVFPDRRTCTQAIERNNFDKRVYLDTGRKKWGQVLLDIVSNDAIYLLHISSQLLLEKQSWIFALNLVHFKPTERKVGRRRG